MKNDDSFVKYGCIIVLLIMILLAILFLIFILWQSGNFQFDLNQFSFISVQNDQVNESSGFRQEDTLKDPEYQEHTFLPFEFGFDVPADWFVKTTEIGGDPPTQKCLTYHIISPGEFATLEVVPMCGAFGGGHMDCPKSIKPIVNLSNYSIGRYPASVINSHRSGIIYSDISREDNNCIGLVSNNDISMKITAHYNGPDSEWPRYLRELDKIVISLVK